MNKQNVKYSAIYFDLDSTLVDIEGLDELAKFYNKKAEVAKLTKKSMSGDVNLEDVFALKLAMIRPCRDDFKKLGKLYKKHVVEDAKETINVLQLLHKDIILMTGNFYPAVSYVTKYLGILDRNVYANQILFDNQGNYLTFDSKGPLSIAGGKRSLMLILKRNRYKVVFVGDGSTDVATKPPVDLFIGYGGVVARQNVKTLSDVFLTSKSIATILPFILNKEEVQKIMKTKYASLMKKAQRLTKTKAKINI